MVKNIVFGILHKATYNILFIKINLLRMEHIMKNNKTFRICITAVFIALVYICTAFIKIPIPLGYAHIGNSIILLASFYFTPWIACISGGIGSSMADILTGFPIWAVPTLFIKIGIAFIACKIFKLGNKTKSVYSKSTLAGAILSMIFMVAAYTIVGAVLYGSIAAGLSSTLGLAAEGVVNIIVFYVLGTILDKAGIRKLISEI